MNEVVIGVIGMGMVLLLFLTGLELGFVMAIVGFLGFSCIVSVKAAFTLLAQDVFDVFTSYGFTVIPLFILMGQIAFKAGIAKKLYDASYKFFGHIPGGLAMATVAGATAFKAVCGSSPATVATFAMIAIPEMDQYKYSKKLSSGTVAIVGTLGVLLPPSVTLIVYGLLTEQSIGKLFIAGLLPGLTIALFFVLIIYGWCKINPTIGPRGGKATWRERSKSLPEVIWVLIIFFLVVGGLMVGFFTPTEAGSVGTCAVLVLAVSRRGINFKVFIESVMESLRTACMVLILLAGSAIMGHFLAVTKLPMMAADWTVKLPLNGSLIVIIILVIYQIGGSFIDDLAFMILATPIFLPAVIKLGFDPTWFGIIVAVNLMIGCVIPPVALNVFVVRKITNLPFGLIYSGVYPFLISIIVCGALLFLFPQFALFLPSLVNW